MTEAGVWRKLERGPPMAAVSLPREAITLSVSSVVIPICSSNVILSLIKMLLCSRFGLDLKICYPIGIIIWIRFFVIITIEGEIVSQPAALKW